MAYPWPSFSTFKFDRSEQPIFGTDSRWQTDPSYDRARPLGSASDSIVTMAIGSSVRSFECYLSPSRFDELQALVTLAGEFTDWDRPLPNTRDAMLLRLQVIDGDVAVYCPDGVTRKRFRTLVELVSQSASA